MVELNKLGWSKLRLNRTLRRSIKVWLGWISMLGVSWVESIGCIVFKWYVGEFKHKWGVDSKDVFNRVCLGVCGIWVTIDQYGFEFGLMFGLLLYRL